MKHSNPNTQATTYTLPTWTASYLINGDAEGLSAEDIARVDAFCEREDHPHFTAIEEGESFAWFTDLDNKREGCTVATFHAFVLIQD
jgi:hypothetical protein